MSFPDYKDVITKPEILPVDTKIPLVGRDEEFAELATYEANNLYGYMNRTLTQRLYNVPLVHGALGVGKTRLIAEFTSSIRNRHTLSGPVASVYMDLSRGDAFIMGETSMRASLGMRLASHFFFGKTCDWLIDQLGILKCQELFPFGNVIQVIKNFYYKDKPLVLTLHIDEFGTLSTLALDELMKIIATHMSTQHDSQVWLLPYLTGTMVEIGVSSISSSHLSPKDLLLRPLARSASELIVSNALKNTDKKDLAGTSLLRIAISSLGDNPRNIQLFLNVLARGLCLPI